MYEYVLCVAKNIQVAPPFCIGHTEINKRHPMNSTRGYFTVYTFPPESVTFDVENAIYHPQDMSGSRTITRLLDTVRVENYTNTDAFKLEGNFLYSQNQFQSILDSGDVISIAQVPFRPCWVKRGGTPKKMHNMLTQDTYDVGTNETASSELMRALGSSDVFSNPKPVSLIKILCDVATRDDMNAYIMDFFAGSCTTAEAVMRLNAQDGGNRRFIMVQSHDECRHGSDSDNTYQYLTDIGMARIRSAGQHILSGYTHPNWNRDVHFHCLRIDYPVTCKP